MFLVKCKYEKCNCVYTLDRLEYKEPGKLLDDCDEMPLRKCPNCGGTHNFGPSLSLEEMSMRHDCEVYRIPDNVNISDFF